ncbi:MAG TPA: PH domain-containing protein [bacterium]|nr:PH domain-containing protein [bacterium]
MFSLKYLPHKEPDEKIIFCLHRHGFVLFAIAMAFLIIALLPLGAYFLVMTELAPFSESEFFQIFLRLLVFVFYLFWWLLFYYAFLDYYLDVWVVTNYRVIGVEQKGLFNRKVSEYKLFRIQDVMAEQKGVFSTVLDYGTVHVQTAGEQEMVNFQQVPNPNHIARELIRLIEFNKQRLAKNLENKENK